MLAALLLPRSKPSWLAAAPGPNRFGGFVAALQKAEGVHFELALRR
jgi:hypothetical protein